MKVRPLTFASALIHKRKRDFNTCASPLPLKSQATRHLAFGFEEKIELDCGILKIHNHIPTKNELLAFKAKTPKAATVEAIVTKDSYANIPISPEQIGEILREFPNVRILQVDNPVTSDLTIAIRCPRIEKLTLFRQGKNIIIGSSESPIEEVYLFGGITSFDARGAASLRNFLLQGNADYVDLRGTGVLIRRDVLNPTYKIEELHLNEAQWAEYIGWQKGDLVQSYEKIDLMNPNVTNRIHITMPDNSEITATQWLASHNSLLLSNPA